MPDSKPPPAPASLADTPRERPGKTLNPMPPSANNVSSQAAIIYWPVTFTTKYVKGLPLVMSN